MQNVERSRPVQMTEEAGTEYFEVLQRLPSRLYYVGAMASLVGSALMFAWGKRHWGLFLQGLTPTLLILPMFHKLLRPSREPMVSGLEEASREARRGTREFSERR